ncbi:MAG: hypothetical protein IKK74_01400 [Clostridia bacterium]|nr:hypothetical protein [Clostridia bacterium]
MKFNHNGYLNYELPDNWCDEEDNDNLLMYNPDGDGAITLSFLNVLNGEKSLAEHISIIAKRFIDQNNINLHSPLILFNRDGKTILWGTGTTSDNWFIKLWIVAKYPKIVLATYLSEQKNDEVKICDSIIDSFMFTF